MERYQRGVEHWEKEFERNRALHGQRIRCRRGCDDCCHQLFQITELEAAQVSRGVRQLPADLQDLLRSRATAYQQKRAELVASRGQVESWGALQPEGLRLPCPALLDGACTIYDSRPMICRKFGVPLWNPDRPGRVHACQLNFQDGEEIQDGQLIQIQTGLHQDWKALQADYNSAGGYRDASPVTIARAIAEDCSHWFPPTPQGSPGRDGASEASTAERPA